jgi:CBS domain containing-hemolysin-like protein
MSPFIWVFNGAANSLLRVFGVEPINDPEGHSPDEIRFLVMQAHARGTLDESDRAMLAGVLDFHEKKARDVMRPRTEVVALDIEATEEEVWEILRRERYSRYPVYRDSLDDVTGVFLAKDLWLHSGDAPFNLADFVREPMYAGQPSGGTSAGRSERPGRTWLSSSTSTAAPPIVTMEDLVEEVVGDIADEYDFASRESIVTDGVLELAGSLSLIDVRSDYRIQIPTGLDYAGRLRFREAGTATAHGGSNSHPGGEMEVVAMDGRRIAALRIHRAGIRQPAVAQHA